MTEETETWRLFHGGEIEVPKGTFDKLWFEEDEDEDF